MQHVAYFLHRRSRCIDATDPKNTLLSEVMTLDGSKIKKISIFVCRICTGPLPCCNNMSEICYFTVPWTDTQTVWETSYLKNYLILWQTGNPWASHNSHSLTNFSGVWVNLNNIFSSSCKPWIAFKRTDWNNDNEKALVESLLQVPKGSLPELRCPWRLFLVPVETGIGSKP